MSFGPALQVTSNDDDDATESDIALSVAASYQFDVRPDIDLDFNAGLSFEFASGKVSLLKTRVFGIGLDLEAGLLYHLSDKTAIRTGLQMSVPLHSWGSIKAGGEKLDLDVNPRSVAFSIPLGIAYLY